MKIAIVIEKADLRGGQNRVATELGRRLGRQHEVHIFCFEAADRVEGVTYHIMPCPLKRRPIIQEMMIPLVSRLVIKPRNFDVILAQGGNCTNANATLVHTSQVQYAAVKEEVLLSEPTMPRWEKTIRRWWQKRAIAYEGRVVRQCRGAVMTVSEEVRQAMMRYWGLREDEIFTTPNGVDHERFHLGLRNQYRQRIREQHGIPEQAFAALFIGYVWKAKGVDRLLRAFGMINDMEMHLLVVGDGDPEQLAEYMPRELAGNIHFTGHQPPEGYYGAADCLVLPSRHEGLALVLVEAAACGLPIICTPMGGAGAIVEQGVSGYVIPQARTQNEETQTAQQIAEHITQLAADRPRARQMGLAARERSLEFTWERQAQLVEGVLASLSKQTPSPGP
jgi:glycosyltransferase involved in cell wall biosynthesis